MSTDEHKGRARLRNARPTIGLLSEVGGSSYYSALWAGFAAAAPELNVNLICYVGGTINAAEYGISGQPNILYDLVTSERIDGLIICGAIGNFVTTDEFRRFVDRYRPLPMVGIAQAPGLPCVVVNNEIGMRDIVTHFIEVHGYRRIAFICGPEGNEEAVLRYRAYVQALAEHDLPLDPDLIAPGAFADNSGIEAIHLFLDERQVEFDAVVAANDWTAFGVLRALEERGIRVPDDVALAGFDDTREAAASRPSLTTVRQPIQQLGRASLEVLLKLLAGEQVPEQTMLPTRLVVRRSCGCSEPVVAHAAAGPLKRKRGPLLEAVAAQREMLLSKMMSALGDAASSSSKWAGRLLDAFVEEMTSDSAASGSGVGPAPHSPFLSVLDDVLRQAIVESSQVDDWQEAISVMRRHLLPYLTSVATLSRVEDLFSQARVMLGRTVQWNWARQEVEETRRAAVLNNLSNDLVAVVETEQILDVVSRRLPQLGFPIFYLSFYDGQGHPAEESRLVLAYDGGGRVEVDPGGRRFPTYQLVPEALFPQGRRYTWVVEALNFRETHFGYLILETESREGEIFGTVARQISGALQDSLLIQQLENRRLYLMTAAEVSRAASSILDLDELIQQVVNLVKERFSLYYVGLFLLDRTGEWTGEPGRWTVLRAGTGEVGRKMLAEGHKLEIGGASMIGQCMVNGQACVALSVDQEIVRFENPLLPETQSELALPLISRGEAIGALTVQSVGESAFFDEDITILQTMADQVANVIENVRLFERTQTALAEMETTYRRYLQQAWGDYTSTLEDNRGYLRSRDGEGPTMEAWLPIMTAAVQQADTVVGRDEQDGSTLAIPLTVSGEIVGVLGGNRSDAEGWSEEDIATVEAIIEQVALALENQRLFNEAQRATFLMSERVKDLDCLNDIGRRMEEVPPLPEFLQWVTQRVPEVMRYTEVCTAAVEYEGQVYGMAEAVELPHQIAQALRVRGETVGRITIAYTEKHGFLDEESALLGDVARRVGGYLENQQLLQEAQSRAQREQILREITTHVRASTDPATIMRTAVRELGTALKRPSFVRLGSFEELSRRPEAADENDGGKNVAQEGGE
jgi:DNA-binding LacI/PurR family transcriptional regulator/GAF domain-containing protein